MPVEEEFDITSWSREELDNIESHALSYEKIADLILKGQKKADTSAKKAEKEAKKAEAAYHKTKAKADKASVKKTEKADKASVKEAEKEVKKAEREAKASAATAKKTAKESSKRGGIFGVAEQEKARTYQGLAPREKKILKKYRKEVDPEGTIEAALIGEGRIEKAKNPKRASGDTKIRPTHAEPSTLDSIFTSLGIKKHERKTAKDSLVVGRAPSTGGDNEFLKVRDRVEKMEFAQKGIARQMTRTQSLLGGASGSLGTVSGFSGVAASKNPQAILGLATSLGSRIPIVGIAIAAAAGVAKAYIAAYIGQYGPGGPRDVRKAVLAESESLVGVSVENRIYSGSALFFSNPSKNQGLPTGNSASQDLRDGLERHRLRKAGKY